MIIYFCLKIEAISIISIAPSLFSSTSDEDLITLLRALPVNKEEIRNKMIKTANTIPYFFPIVKLLNKELISNLRCLFIGFLFLLKKAITFSLTLLFPPI